MTTQMIIQAYLKALNIPKVKSLEDIYYLIQQHEKNLAFSSLKVLLKENISLDLEAIYNSLVVQKRGGYCFEHNKLIYEALKYLGFDVQFFLARVVNNLEVDVPQTHRFTVLNYDNERYLIDVGIGFRSPNVPIKFNEKATYSHLGLSYKILLNEDATYNLLVDEHGQWFKATKFDLNPCNEADCEMGHFYSYQHPCAVFVNNLVISRIEQHCIYSLRNKDYIKIYENEFVKIPIENEEQFFHIIKEDFKVNFVNDELSYLYQTYIKK